jgi:hypothetical protein
MTPGSASQVGELCGTASILRSASLRDELGQLGQVKHLAHIAVPSGMAAFDQQLHQLPAPEMLVLASPLLLVGFGKRSQLGTENLRGYRVKPAFSEEVGQLPLRADEGPFIVVTIAGFEMGARALLTDSALPQEVPNYPSISLCTCTALLLQETLDLRLRRMLVLVLMSATYS